jgi:molybdate transport system substrate-binding protein
MRRSKLTSAAIVGVVFLLAQVIVAKAAEIKIIAGTAMSGVLGELGPQFERASGHKLVVQYGLGPPLKKQIESGEPFDLVILSDGLMNDLAKQGRFASSTPTAIARLGMGVAVRAGAPKPDISSVDSFKQTLLDAKSVTFVPQGVSGAYVLSVFKRLGISEQMNTKIKPVNVAEHVAETVAKGEAELALFAANLLVSVPGVGFVGSFPAGLQQYFVFTAAIGADAKQAEPARALIKHLTAPAAATVIKAKGMEPVIP